MLKLIKGATVYAPEPLGVKDVLIADRRIAAIEEVIAVEGMPVTTVEAGGLLMVPGFIDNHVHLLGGGGEGGYKTRTPELVLEDLIEAGVTTVVGCLGTDGVTRQLSALVAKAYGLREEGVSAYVYTGSYRVPPVTVTGDVQKDLLMIEPVIGVGEIALSDHRGSAPSGEAVLKVLTDARVGGMLSGKSGIVNVHLGDGKAGFRPIVEALAASDVPITQLLPTHTNRSERVYRQALDYAKDGGYIDFTTAALSGELSAHQAYARAVASGVSTGQMTFSSDGQGSLPKFSTEGTFLGLGIGKVSTLYAAFKALVVTHGFSIDRALLPVTSTPAKVLKLSQKGRLRVGGDADCLLIAPKDLSIDSVYAMGTPLMQSGRVTRHSTFYQED